MPSKKAKAKAERKEHPKPHKCTDACKPPAPMCIKVFTELMKQIQADHPNMVLKPGDLEKLHQDTTARFKEEIKKHDNCPPGTCAMCKFD